MTIAGSELGGLYRNLAEQLTVERQAWDDAKSAIQAEHEKIRIELQTLCLDLARVYLPKLDLSGFEQVSRKTGFRGFERYDPLKAMEKEQRALERELVQIQGDEEYRRREYLVGQNGNITLSLNEAADHLRTWQAECDRFEKLEGFIDLVDSNYDTANFDHRWWSTVYWKRWAAGDRICETLGMSDFGDDVLPAYHQVSEPRSKWKAEVERILAERNRILGKVKRHDDAQYRLTHLESIYLDEGQQALSRHLQDADPSLLATWSDGDRGIEILLRKLSGLKAKNDYFDELAKQLVVDLQGIEQRIAKANQKATKFQRSKHYYSKLPDDQRPDPLIVEKMQNRRSKYLSTSQKIGQYSRYERFDIQNDPNLWWLEFTGRPPGPFYPGLQQWYSRNPSINITYLDHDHVIPALATSHRSHDDLGDLS